MPEFELKINLQSNRWTLVFVCGAVIDLKPQYFFCSYLITLECCGFFCLKALISRLWKYSLAYSRHCTHVPECVASPSGKWLQKWELVLLFLRHVSSLRLLLTRTRSLFALSDGHFRMKIVTSVSVLSEFRAQLLSRKVRFFRTLFRPLPHP